MMLIERRIDVPGIDARLRMEIDGDPEFLFQRSDFGDYIRIDSGLTSISSFRIRSFSVSATVPIIDLHGVSIPGSLDNRLSTMIPWYFEDEVALHRGFPFFSLINRAGINRFALGLSSPTPGYRLKGRFVERSEEIEVSMEMLFPFVGTGFRNSIFLSAKPISWFELTGEYAGFTDVQPRRIRDYMLEPVYCTWYAFYQELQQEQVNDVARRAAQLGFGTFITDDGWFTEDTGRGYWHTGDWEVCRAKFPDFLEHVRTVKSHGLRYILWIAPFMVGLKSDAYRELKGFVVRERENLGYGILCPQSDVVKERVLAILRRLLHEYQLDGFKIDFIDDIPIGRCSESSHRHFADDPSSALESIFEEVNSLRTESGDELIIEFRQRYASPQMERYATAFRAADTPFDFDQNRRRILLLRAFTRNLPVYSDPIVWRRGESPENISRHFISAIYSVPMVSMNLLELNDTEECLIRFWLKFFKTMKNVLLRGKLRVDFSAGEFTKACSSASDTAVCSLYAGAVLNPDNFGEFREFYVLNASTKNEIVISSRRLKGTHLRLRMRGCDGESLSRVRFDGLMSINLPPDRILHIGVENGQKQAR